MRHWTRKGDALEALHRAHSISTVSYNRVELDPLERSTQGTIERRERQLVIEVHSSSGSCDEDMQEIKAEEFEANIERRRRVRRRVQPSDDSPEASRQGSSEEYQPSPEGIAAEEEDVSLIAEMIRETEWETQVAQEEDDASEEPMEDVLPVGLV